jgi:hypothetical protein
LRRLAFLWRLALIALALLVWSMDSHAARDFTSTDVINYGSAASVDGPPDNAGTAIFWLFPDASTAGTWFAKSAQTFLVNATATSLQVTHARGTQSLVALSTFANASTYGNNKWCYVAATWDTAGANGDQQIWHGDLSTIVAETAAYSTQRVGSGTVTSTAASNLLFGNRDAGTTPLDGKAAFVGLWNRRLSLGELKDQQFWPHVTSGNVVFDWVGFSASPEPDWSGNGNAGTVTGTTLYPNVPLGVRFGGR